MRFRDFFMVLVVGCMSEDIPSSSLGRRVDCHNGDESVIPLLLPRSPILLNFLEALARVELMTKIVSSLFFLPYEQGSSRIICSLVDGLLSVNSGHKAMVNRKSHWVESHASHAPLYHPLQCFLCLSRVRELPS